MEISQFNQQIMNAFEGAFKDMHEHLIYLHGDHNYIRSAWDKPFKFTALFKEIDTVLIYSAFSSFISSQCENDIDLFDVIFKHNIICALHQSPGEMFVQCYFEFYTNG